METFDNWDCEEEMIVILNDDCSVNVINDEGQNYKIIGFDSYKNEKDFIFFGDFATPLNRNDYITITQSKEELQWILE